MSKFKVIDTSNHDLESVADVLIADGFDTEQEAQQIANEHNKDRTDHSTYWAMVVPADKTLWRGMEELV